MKTSVAHHLLMSLALAVTAPARAQTTHVVTVNPDGSLTPDRVEVVDGDTVEWRFPARGGSVIPVDPVAPGSGPCPAYRPYDPDDPNEFTGPMPQAVSGIFSLSPQDSPYASQEATWWSPNLTGVFIRLRWNDVQPAPDRFDWSEMDAEIEQAVSHGKLYSLGFKAGSHGTPQWIFDPDRTDAPVEPLDFGFREGGKTAYQGSPADPHFRQHYFAFLRAAADHIRLRNAWFRALAYIKICGVNIHTHENRLQNETVEDLATWAGPGRYTPTALFAFYDEQTVLLAELFPGKDMSYALIQDGFPRINDQGEYFGQPTPPENPLPTGASQTEFLLNQGRLQHGLRFVVQHNGLQAKPDFCPGEGQHPIEVDPDFHYVSSGCPNRWVLQQSQRGQVTGYQTVAGLETLFNLEAAFQNAWDNSDAIFVEIYENFALGADANGLPSGASLGEWAERFHQRRREMWPDLPDPFPTTYQHTFTRTVLAGSADPLLHYVSGAHCGNGTPPPVGEISIVPVLRFSAIGPLPNRRVGLELDVRRAGTVRVEYADQPQGPWTLLATRATSGGLVQLADVAPAAQNRFYRALLGSP